MKKERLQNKHQRAAIALLLILAMILTTVNINDLVAAAASKPKFQKTKVQLAKGKSTKLKVKNLPKSSKIVKTKWSVQNKKVLKLTLSGSKTKKKKATTAKIKALKTGNSAVYCTITYRVKKSGNWKTKKTKLKATVAVASPSKTTPKPSEAGKPQASTSVSPDSGNTPAPSDNTANPDTNSTTPPGPSSPNTDNTTPPEPSSSPDTGNTTPPGPSSPGTGDTEPTSPGNATTPPSASPTPGGTTQTPALTPTTAEPLIWTGLLVKTIWTNSGEITGSYSQIDCSPGLEVISDRGCWNFLITSTKWNQYNYPMLKCYRAEGDTTAETLDIWYGSNEDEQIHYPYAEWSGDGIALDKSKVSNGIRIANNTPVCRIEIYEGKPEEAREKDIGSNDFSKTAMDFSKELKIGWNVGNSLDSIIEKGEFVPGTAGLAAETAGNVMITENLIKAVKDADFNTIRVPVTWTNHTDPDNNYQIDEMWMNRVEEVVQYCTANGLYVLLNVHHDGNDDPKDSNSWLSPEPSDAAAMKERYQRIWEQIADRFKDYSNLLLFESMNEFHHGYSTTPPASYYQIQNELHQIFVNTVRKSGGNNANRYLIIPGYNTNIENTIDGLELPTDSCKDHLMVEVHYYDPFNFAGDDHTIEQWGTDFSSADKSLSSGRAQEKYLIEQLEKMKSNYIDKKIPVVIGEFGATERKDPNNEKYRIYYLQYMVKYCTEYGLIPIYWDNGYDFRLFNRNTYEVVYPNVVDDMLAAMKSGYEIPIP